MPTTWHLCSEAGIHNWEEDFSDENGKYHHVCSDCSTEFMGHKRRVCCKKCAKRRGGIPVREITKEDCDRIVDKALQMIEKTGADLSSKENRSEKHEGDVSVGEDASKETGLILPKSSIDTSVEVTIPEGWLRKEMYSTVGSFDKVWIPSLEIFQEPHMVEIVKPVSHFACVIYRELGLKNEQ